MRKTITATLVTGLVSLMCLFSPAALAQSIVSDHLKCYKVKDSIKLKGTLDADTTLFGVDPNCKVTKAKFLCVPSQKNNVSVSVPVLGITGAEIPGQQLCYKVKCKGPAPSDQQTTDQFGTRTLSKFKAKLLCSPAFAGAPVAVAGLSHAPLGNATLAVTGTAPDETLSVSNITTDVIDGVSTDLTGRGGSQFWTARIAAKKVAKFKAGAALALSQRVENGTVGGDIEVKSSGSRMRVYAPGQPVYGDVTASFAVDADELRTGTVSCGGVVVDTATETTSGDPEWLWLIDDAPDTFQTELVLGTGPRKSAFVWSTDCVSIVDPNTGASVLGDRLTISVPSGIDVASYKSVEIVGNAALDSIDITAESINDGSLPD